LAVLSRAVRGLNILRVCETVAAPPVLAARVYARLGDLTGINWVYRHLSQAAAGDVWDSMVQVDLRWTLLDLQRELTERLLMEQPEDPSSALEAFAKAHAEALAGVRALQQRAVASGSASALAVVTQRLRKLRAPA
ncbi:MAG: NAD-glutamate dehydrogenase, partial [Thermoleophilia bacterium]|nr:NAD-glutamate dehydrogenase [Thermoleophilia bacterium]